MTRRDKNLLLRAVRDSVRSAPPKKRNKHFVVAAVRVNGNRIEIASNRNDTHPLMAKISDGHKCCVHAEVRVLSRFLNREDRLEMEGPLLVARKLASADFGLAKPCEYCESFIREHFPKMKIYYTDCDGAISPLLVGETNG